MADNDFWDLQDNVVKRGLCTECGTCIGVCSTKALKFDFENELPILEGFLCGLWFVY
jgi:ferredoxin